jgi:threonine/homoserine/homoserine lactone efflux protein
LKSAAILSRWLLAARRPRKESYAFAEAILLIFSDLRDRVLILQQFLGFLVAGMLITVSPGPDNLMVLSMSISKGLKQGIAFGLGCALGCLSHTLLAVAGISALIAASPATFIFLKLAGGLYLLWLGVNVLRSAGIVKLGVASAGGTSLSSLFLKGVVANALNPKVALFFLSFLPQFVIPANESIGWQTAALGLAFTVQTALLFGLLGYFSGSVGQWLSTRPRAGVILDWIAAGVFIGLGLRLMRSR